MAPSSALTSSGGRRQGAWRCFALTLVAIIVASAGHARACVSFAEKVIAWDVALDLYVVATYNERAVAPAPRARVNPNFLELRRLSTGAQLALYNCAREPGGLAAAAAEPCDYRAVFGGRVPAGARFREASPGVRGWRFSIGKEAARSEGRRALLVSSPKRRGWQRVRYLEGDPAAPDDKVHADVTLSDREGHDILVGIAEAHRSPSCRYVQAKLLRLRDSDVAEPAALAHQQALLDHLKDDGSLATWRTIAEIGPIPPKYLVLALRAATEAHEPRLGAKWWQDAVADLPIEQIGPLAAAVRADPGLRTVEALLSLPPAPEEKAASAPVAPNPSPAPAPAHPG